LILDESRDGDESCEIEGISFLISKPVISSMQRNGSVVAIDFVEEHRGKGFRLFLKETPKASA
jgi:hypothetical protein